MGTMPRGGGYGTKGVGGAGRGLSAFHIAPGKKWGIHTLIYGRNFMRLVNLQINRSAFQILLMPLKQVDL